MDVKILTIVVPAYNVQEYLGQCLDTFIVEEIMNDIEVLVINDGSTDKTKEIAMCYEEKYPSTFKVISKENGGHGSAINSGIQLATGKFFKVVDGDDWVNKQVLSKIVSILKSINVDLLVTNYCEYNVRESLVKEVNIIKNIEYGKIYNFDDIATKCFIPMTSFTIKTDILKKNNIYIDEKMFYVDMEFVLFPVPFIQNVMFSEDYLYVYRLGTVSQSVSRMGWYNNRKHHAIVILKLIEFAEKYRLRKISPEKMEYLSNKVLGMVRWYYKVNTNYYPIKDFKIINELEEFELKFVSKSKFYYGKSNCYNLIKILRISNLVLFKPLQIYFFIKRNVLRVYSINKCLMLRFGNK